MAMHPAGGSNPRGPRNSPRIARLAFSVLLAVPLALLALAPLAGRAAAHPAHATIGKSSGPAVIPTLHYHSALAGLFQPERTATDAQGNVYASDANLNRVLMFDANDNFVRYFGTGTVGTGSGDFNHPAGIAIGGGTIFVADRVNHQIQTFDQNTDNFVSQFGSTHLVAPDGIALASNGTLYVADSSANQIVEFNTSGTYLGSFGSGPGSGNGQFNEPVAIAASPFGSLYVVDLANTRVQRFTLGGAYVSQWGHSTFGTPDGIAVDRAGMVYVSDRGANTVYKFDPNGSLVGSYAAPTTTPFVQGTFITPADVAVRDVPNQPIQVYVSDQSEGVVQRFDQVLDPQLHTYQAQWGGSGIGSGQFSFPAGIVVDNASNVYVADSLNNRIEKFDPFGNFLLAFGTSGSGQLSDPFGLAMSLDGTTLYVADKYDERVAEFTTAGAYIGQIGTGSSGTGNGEFNYPAGVATDGSFIYVTDSLNNRVQVFDTSGTYQYQFGSFGSNPPQFKGPSGIAVDIARQELFIADYGNNRVQVYTTGGQFVFSLTSTGVGSFNLPAGVSTDQRGDVYIADSTHDQIVEYDVNTTRVTAFGTNGVGNGQFGDPFAVAVSPTSGQLYIADSSNNRVQRFGSPWPKNDTVGIYRPSAKTFYLRNSNSTGPADISVYMPYALAGDIPVVGDWEGDGVDTVGLYRPSKARFLLQDANMQESAPDYVFTLGIAGDTPIVGDWNGAGSDGAGIFRPSNGILYLKNSLSTGVADYNLVLGKPGDVGISGDWNGDGQDSPGVYRPSNQRFYVTNKVTDGVVFSDASAILGISGDVPFTGDWVAQGSSGIGVFRPTNGVTYEKNTIVTGPADNNFVYGVAGDVPVAGQWVAPSVPFSVPAPHVSLGVRGGASHPMPRPTAPGGQMPATTPRRTAAR